MVTTDELKDPETSKENKNSSASNPCLSCDRPGGFCLVNDPDRVTCRLVARVTQCKGPVLVPSVPKLVRAS